MMNVSGFGLAVSRMIPRPSRYDSNDTIFSSLTRNRLLAPAK